jgi:hypothetical protein
MNLEKKKLMHLSIISCRGILYSTFQKGRHVLWCGKYDNINFIVINQTADTKIKNIMENRPFKSLLLHCHIILFCTLLLRRNVPVTYGKESC